MLHFVAYDIDAVVTVVIARQQTIFSCQEIPYRHLIQLMEIFLRNPMVGVCDKLHPFLHSINAVLSFAGRRIASEYPPDAVT